ncbi:MAG: T9SS type A sorting domain-containing protein [Bacteroidia bacterium]|nr:T9SS type A sorting domain-containing protein [Bacteroidia bacterium]
MKKNVLVSFAETAPPSASPSMFGSQISPHSRRKSSLFFGIFFSLIFLFISQAKSQCYAPPNYCTAITAANNANYGMGIQNVTLYTSAIPSQINNNSTAGTGTQIYFDYTSQIVRAGAGDSVYFSVKGGSSNQTIFRIYIDYNNDGTFATTAPELVFTSPNLTVVNTVVNGSFILPTTLTSGPYRVRVASDGQGIIPQPCGPITYSAEYEDYTLMVPSSNPDLISGAITSPSSAIVGNNTVAFNFTNISTTTITSVDVSYQLDNNTPVTQSLSSISILPGATYTATFSTQVALPSTGTFNLRAWTDNPNYLGNNTPGNDTICKNIVTYCSGPLSGTYTINPTGSGTTNYKSFGGIDSAMASCGVSGAVTVNVTPGIYNENLIFTAIPGASATNNITFNGNGSSLLFNCSASDIALVRFQGAKHITIDSLTLKTTNATYGWGVHFYQNSDSNTVKNCIIDISTVTSSTAANSAGVIFSNSLTSPTTTGNTCVGNTIENNYIKGNPTSYGLYYGIVGCPSTSSTTYTGNKFLRNRIENFYIYGIYWSYGNRTVFRGNTITRPSKTLVSTTYAFYLSSASRSDTVDANIITNLFGGAPTSTGTTYLFYGINRSGSSTEPNIFTNNLAYNMNGEGAHYGFYFLTSYNNHLYNNTLLFDNASSASANVTYGLYFTGGTSASSTLNCRNNIFSITRGGAGSKYGIYTNGAWTTGATVNKNAYYGIGANYNMGYYVGTTYSTLANWKTSLTTLDQQSIDYAPNFVNPATGNFSPRDGAYDGAGDNVITIVPRDITGATRSLPMDIGAFEASPIGLDAAMSEVTMPVAPYIAGSKSFSAKIRNAGTTTITSATINWSINGVTQTPVSYTGTLTGGSVSSSISLGTYTIAGNTLYDIQVWVSNPNSSTDPNPDNNQIGGLTAAQVSGILTINSAGSGAGVFTTFKGFTDLISIGGLGGAVTANVTVGSGPYTEQVFLGFVPGASATNTITINGNGETLQFNNVNSGSIGIFNLIGTDYCSLSNLYIKSLNTTYGIGIILSAGATYNTIQNCTINISSISSSSYSAGIAFTASQSNATTAGLNGTNNLIEGNSIIGNSTGGPYYGISYLPTNTSNAANTGNIIRNNEIKDFYYYGIYMSYSAGTIVTGNVISRPTKASPTTFMGIYASNGLAQDTFENNIIKQPFAGLTTTTGTFYGIYFASGNVPAARPVIVRNNQIYDIVSNGAIYGVYKSTTANIRFYNNTIVVDHPSSTSTGLTYLFYSTSTFSTTTVRNNIFYLNRGGSGAKYIYYLNTTGTGYVINNNDVKLYTSGSNNNVGYYGGAFTTFASWQTANSGAFDQNSVTADPYFRLYVGSEFYQPGSDSLNNIGFSTPDVPRDITGALRSSTPDLGVYEFSVPAVDAGLTRVVTPISPLSLGGQNIDVMVKSFGPTALTSTNIGWEMNGVSQTPATWYGYLGNGDSSSFNLAYYSFTNPGFYRIKAWTYAPNGLTDSLNMNDTINVTLCTALNGDYTVNPALPATDTNFVSLKTFLETVQLCGVAGPVKVAVSPGSYNGSIALFAGISGISATNNIEIIGADSATTKIIHDGSGQRATILMSGAKHFTFRNLTIENTAIVGGSGGFGVLFTNAADSNRLVGCNIKVATLTAGYSTFVPVLSTANVLSANTAGNNANYLTIDSCTMIGGYYGVSLYNNSTAKSEGNKIRDSRVLQAYYAGIYSFWQNKIVIHRNKITNTGNNTNTSSFGMYIYQCDNGINVTKNEVTGQLGGYGTYLYQNFGTSTNRNIFANNMIQLGSASYTSYGLYDGGNVYSDIAHNSIHNTSGDASYVSCGLYFNYSNPSTGSNARIVNNVISSPNGAMVIYCPNTASLSTSTMFIDNNSYYSPSTYPFRIVNTIYQALFNYRLAMGAFVPGIDSNSIWVQPSFFSTTNLRSITPQLDSMGYVLPTVTDDIDGNPRSTNAPDAGVNEFFRPGEDAGVIAILQPTLPVAVGSTDVQVVIKNFGLNTITSVDVNYSAGSTVQTRTYSGTLLAGAIDTVLFDTSSGAFGASQRFVYTGGAVTLKAYTTNPNLTADPQTLNDTTSISFCSALNGVYTINPSGSGSNNFLTFADAINRLNCDGVTGNVTFNVASGTYVGQIDLTTITGTSDSSKVVFKSVTNNPADVTLTSNTSTTLENYTLRLKGVSYVSFEAFTIKNSSTTFSRVISINKQSTNNTNTSNVTIKNCIIEGYNISSTADQYAVIYGPNGDNATNINILNNQIRFGSYGIYFGGQNIINLYSPGLVIDSNTIYRPYYMGLYLLSRNNTKIRGNFLDGHPSYGAYNFYLSGASGDLEIVGNNIQSTYGTYGIYIATCNYYGETGLARVANNIVNMTSTGTQYGMYFANGSNCYFINNTVNCASTSTSTYAYYLSGNTTSATVPQIVQTSNIRLINNILYSNAGYSTYYANFYSVSGTSESNNNLYYSGGTNFAFVNGLSYTPASFIASYRNLLYAGSDRRSLLAPITFTSSSNLTPLVSSSTAWASNGRGVQSFFVNKDIFGNPRSQMVSTGVTDIGAVEFTPTSNPPSATLTGSIGGGNTQDMIVYGDTVARLIWGYGGTLPTSINATYHTGALINEPTNGGRNPGAEYMDVFWKIAPNGGSAYSFDLKLNFDPNMLGTVPSMSDIKMAARVTGVSGSWTHFGSSATSVDSLNYNFEVIGLTDLTEFTGTTDFAPLPVKLTRFEAIRNSSDALLYWNTSSEVNSKAFEIERSADGSKFEKIGTLKAAGNSSKLLSYQFEDVQAANAYANKMAYYRLKMVDVDGSFDYSNVRVVDFNDAKDAEIKVFPNPFSDKLTITLSSISSENVQVEIVDLFGKVVAQQSQSLSVSNPEVLVPSLSKLSNGVYIIRIISGSDVHTRKLIKE